MELVRPLHHWRFQRTSRHETTDTSQDQGLTRDAAQANTRARQRSRPVYLTERKCPWMSRHVRIVPLPVANRLAGIPPIGLVFFASCLGECRNLRAQTAARVP